MAGMDTARFLTRPPRPSLRHAVLRLTDYAEDGASAAMREPAALVVPVIVSFGAPFAVALGRPPASGDRWGSFTAGLTLRPAHILSGGAAACLQIDFAPLGAMKFLGLPLAALAERLVGLDDLGDRGLAALARRLEDTPDPARRLDLAEDHVADRIRAAAPPDPLVAAAYGSIVAGGGRSPVAQIADRAGCSRQHLSRRLRAVLGVGPKGLSRLARFQTARALAAGADGWADLAAAAGYADQSHLVREFQALGGATPGRFAV